MPSCIVFWQRMLTPHMTELALELARVGADVHYVYETALSRDRRAMGWIVSDLGGLRVYELQRAPDVGVLLDGLPVHAVHITQGVRANGLITAAQREIAARSLRHFPIMEKVDLRGPRGRLKPLLYGRRFRALAGSAEGILAIGAGTKEWIEDLAPRELRVLPFAYFLKAASKCALPRVQRKFRFIFVGSLVRRKRVDLVLEALARLRDRTFEVEVVGEGPLRRELQGRARELLPGRVAFTGTLQMDEAVAHIADADCLILPSAHDGWGAVVSEAQIHGTPVVCSSECGASGTVRASGFGAVFRANDGRALQACLAELLDRGAISAADRSKLRAWANCLTAEAGASYLLEAIANKDVIAPWEKTSRRSVP